MINRHMRTGLILSICLLLLLSAVPTAAQEGTDVPAPTPSDTPTNGNIAFGRPVRDTITEGAIFDRYAFSAFADDEIRAVMTASDGLIPRLGVADSSGTVVLRTDQMVDGTPLDAPEPNSTVELSFTVPEDGNFTLVPGRFGGVDGESTGSYTLELQLVSSQMFLINLPEETFTCDDRTATTLISLRFSAEANSEAYRISAYGDGVDPYLAVLWDNEFDILDCSQDAQTMEGDIVQLPGIEPFTLDSEDPTNAARFTIRGGARIGNVTANIGSIDGATGRFMIVVEGFSLSEARQRDIVEVALGPAIAENGVAVYMVKTGTNRIDPVIEITDEVTGAAFRCDDAGRGDCTAVRSFDGAGVQFTLGDDNVIGDRFSAGAAVVPRHNDLNTIELYSQARNATGSYALVITGELQAVDAGPTRPGG